MRTDHDLIIIGHGLAGGVLASTAINRGIRVRVFDAPKSGQASRVAAGIVNPIVLRRMVPSWRAAEMLVRAEAFFKTPHWHPIPMVRIFGNAQEENYWIRSEADEQAAPFLSREQRVDVDRADIDRGIGYGIVNRCAWLDVNAWLDEQRTALIHANQFREEWVSKEDIVEHADHAMVKGESASFVVLCEGPFTAVPGLVPARGELLTVRIPGLGLKTMIHRGAFLLPLGDDLYRVGSTFAWDDLFVGPTEEGIRVLLERLLKITRVPVELIEHAAGVRPAARDRRPIIGPIGEGSRVAVLNGFGSRGVLLTPWSSAHLLDHLLLGEELDPEVNAARFSV